MKLFKNWTIEEHAKVLYPTPIVMRALLYKGTIVFTWRK